MSGGDHNQADTLEWQVAEGSATAHVIDISKPEPTRSGRAALCGRRPQRNYRDWFALPITNPGAIGALRGYNCTRCPDCDDAIRGVVSS